MIGWILIAFCGCFVLERLAPGWRLPTATCGFEDEREQRVGTMLMYRDVHGARETSA